MAYVLSSISGNLISAASAGFAPTNSADVSAIASAYQVVSATATQLNAGTAYLTSINETPISAARAGNAANASLANSAWYDGTGRLISALPDEATVSSIASAYAESAASSKQDTLSFGYDDDKISAINGSALAGQGGGMITSIESSLDPWYQTAISGLNGSSLYPKWAESAKSATYASTATYATNAQSASAAPTAWAASFITGVASPSGTIRVWGGTAIEATNSAVLPSTVIDGFSVVGTCVGSTTATSLTVPVSNPSTRVHFGDAYAHGDFVIDTDNGIHTEIFVDNVVDVWFDIPFATSFTATYPWVSNMGYTASASAHEEGGGVGELAWASALPTYQYDAEDKISAINGSAIGGAGGVDSATCSAIASAYAESAASSKLDTTAYNSSDFYTTSNPSGFIDSAYVDSAVSGKADSSALSSYVPYSSLEYNTASAISGINGSALAAGSTYSAGEGIDITDDVISVEAPVDIVAGPGITIDNPDGNTLRVSTNANYETVLWSASTFAPGDTQKTYNLSETPLNFENIKVYACRPIVNGASWFGFAEVPIGWLYNLHSSNTSISMPMSFVSTSNNIIYEGQYFVKNTTSTAWQDGSSTQRKTTETAYTTGYYAHLYKIVGVNRTASAQ